jgi:hypothetical protein
VRHSNLSRFWCPVGMAACTALKRTAESYWANSFVLMPPFDAQESATSVIPDLPEYEPDVFSEFDGLRPPPEVSGRPSGSVRDQGMPVSKDAIRSTPPPRRRHLLWFDGMYFCRWVEFFLVSWMFAFMLLRLRKPRAPICELAALPGTAACLAFITCAIVQAFIAATTRIFCALYPAGHEFSGPTAFEVLKEVSAYTGLCVLVAWLILRLTRTSGRHRDWVELFGILLGLGWILLLLEPVLEVALMLLDVMNGRLD